MRVIREAAKQKKKKIAHIGDLGARLEAHFDT